MYKNVRFSTVLVVMKSLWGLHLTTI